MDDWPACPMFNQRMYVRTYVQTERVMYEGTFTPPDTDRLRVVRLTERCLTELQLAPSIGRGGVSGDDRGSGSEH